MPLTSFPRLSPHAIIMIVPNIVGVKGHIIVIIALELWCLWVHIKLLCRCICHPHLCE